MRRKPRPRLAGPEREKLGEQLLQDYDKGNSIRDLAVQYDLSIGLARNLLLESGVQFRSRGGATRNKAKSGSEK